MGLCKSGLPYQETTLLFDGSKQSLISTRPTLREPLHINNDRIEALSTCALKISVIIPQNMGANGHHKRCMSLEFDC